MNMAMNKKHKVQVFRDPSNGELRARCKCGWAGHADDIADHNTPRPVMTPPKIIGFVSGLPDSDRR